ncbi:hypothetical protein LTS08_004759 [Lithohypha guttulata]|uniref:TAFII28-like protein domain-containing protein n=1 Tax=Lithohypha guttulata TaxID=1690604 RepID=A0AAN7T4K6_9EURO|nr:hypothetical protein LTR05_002399 [Lithohypha guttulata]KAK5101153.1 hypothetical protein LTS08_004759 [Lithohypha guttulata]
MASSPPAPFPASLPNPKKRPSISSQVSAANKRPKLHPLRQTSFPANVDGNAYASAVDSARSETGSVANSTFSRMSTSKAQPRGRGRPRKSLQVTEEDAQSARDGTGTTGKASQAKSVVSTAKSGLDAEDEADEEDEEELGEHGHEDGAREGEHEQEEKKLSTFLGQLTAAQGERYANLRSSKFKDSALKRIVNQTVSQSVAQTAISAVQFATKAFAIEIIERAREVQDECAKAADVGIALEKHARRTRLEEKQKALADREKAESEKEPAAAIPEQERRALQLEILRLSKDAEKYIPNKHRGGLLPDHLREALRRYKNDGDGNGFGFGGLSHPLLGIRGSNAWRVGDGAIGQRLFR